MVETVLERLRQLARTPFGAAFLSFVFPGLGQAAAGQAYRGFVIAIPALATLGAVGLIFVFDRHSLLNLALNQQMLTNLLVIDVVGFFYHAWAVVDAYLVARRALALRQKRQSGARRAAPVSGSATMKWASTAAIGVLLVSTVAVHGAVAKVDSDWQYGLYCLTAPIPCWVTDNPSGPDATDNEPDATDIANASDEPAPGDSGQDASLTPMPTYDMSSVPTFNPTQDAQNWAADGELNILLAGIGVQKGGSVGDLGTDSVMVLRSSIKTGQAELISIPRNSYCTPLPTQEIAKNYPHPGYNCPAGSYGPMFMGLANEILHNCKRWPIPEYASTCGQKSDPNRYQRAYKGFEMTVGGLLGIHIDGSVWMNPTGLSMLVDALGGVTVNVTYRVYDKPCGPSGSRQQQLGAKLAIPGNSVCGDTAHWGYYVPTGPDGIARMKQAASQTNGGLVVYSVPGLPYDVGIIINPGTYHMNGEWALAYARTRIYDPQLEFGRSIRQQNFMTSLRKQLDPCHYSSLENVVPLLNVVQAVRGFNTDMDVTNSDNLKAWAGIAKNVLGDNVQKLVLTPQLVGMPSKISYIGWDPSSTLPKARALVKQYFDKSLPSAGASGGSNSGSGSGSGSGAGC